MIGNRISVDALYYLGDILKDNTVNYIYLSLLVPMSIILYTQRLTTLCLEKNVVSDLGAQNLASELGDNMVTL